MAGDKLAAIVVPLVCGSLLLATACALAWVLWQQRTHHRWGWVHGAWAFHQMLWGSEARHFYLNLHGQQAVHPSANPCPQVPLWQGPGPGGGRGQHPACHRHPGAHASARELLQHRVALRAWAGNI